MALEIEQPIAENAELRQRLADVRLNRAQILADDQNAVPDAFETQDMKQIQRVFLHVGSLRRVHVLGYPVQTEEAHDMVDAQHSAKLAAFANRFAKQTKSVFAML